MRALIQRVAKAKVLIQDRNNECSGQIQSGLLIFLGVGQEDTEEEAKFLAKKIVGLRIFDDREGKMNWEISQVGGSVLVVSQFTLFADCSHGKRPSYINAASPEKANRLYEFFKQEIKNFGIHVESGVFQTMMSVQLINDGPVTIALDTELLKKK